MPRATPKEWSMPEFVTLLTKLSPREKCLVIGHVPAPIYVEEDGHCDDYYCKRCGEQI